MITLILKLRNIQKPNFRRFDEKLTSLSKEKKLFKSLEYHNQKLVSVLECKILERSNCDGLSPTIRMIHFNIMEKIVMRINIFSFYKKDM